MKVVMNLFEPELSNWKKYNMEDSEYYILTDKNDLVGENLVLHLNDKESDLYKFAMCALPSLNADMVEHRKHEFTVFENVDDFRKHVNEL